MQPSCGAGAGAGTAGVDVGACGAGFTALGGRDDFTILEGIVGFTTLGGSQLLQYFCFWDFAINVFGQPEHLIQISVEDIFVKKM
jgi:hypothetical protein